MVGFIEHPCCSEGGRRDGFFVQQPHPAQREAALQLRRIVRNTGKKSSALSSDCLENEDVCRTYVSTFNNAALPGLRSPLPWSRLPCGVSPIKHSIKAVSQGEAPRNNVCNRKPCRLRQSVKTDPRRTAPPRKNQKASEWRNITERSYGR